MAKWSKCAGAPLPQSRSLIVTTIHQEDEADDHGAQPNLEGPNALADPAHQISRDARTDLIVERLAILRGIGLLPLPD
ncbi:hypothetical protein XH98_29730 [Bradyrhizobium sp. CCBAU 51745]|nr:hypothetical protein [Bradyrhizobium sp. CCBAU 51745]